MLIKTMTVDNAQELNHALYQRYIELSASEQTRQTHHFAGRFENTWIDVEAIPSIVELIDLVRQQAAQLLDKPVEQLRSSFWFNSMGPGHITAPHHHDEDGELLSACYYIRVPENSGDLLLFEGDEQVRWTPKEGKLVIFRPDLMHEVTENCSQEMRLSVAFNVGPVEPE